MHPCRGVAIASEGLLCNLLRRPGRGACVERACAPPLRFRPASIMHARFLQCAREALAVLSRMLDFMSFMDRRAGGLRLEVEIRSTLSPHSFFSAGY